MRKNIFILSVLMFFLLYSCQKKFYNEVPFKITYNQQEIMAKLGILPNTPNTPNTLPIKDTTLTDREIYLKEKYSIILGIKPEELNNYKFYDFIDRWIGTPYSSKGFTMDSLNIGPFTSALYEYAFKRNLPSTPLGIFKSPEINLFTGREFLKEGDILFFRNEKDTAIGDIAIYLRNNKILVSSISQGLIISNFNSDYFQLSYVSAGRLYYIDQENNK